MNDNVSAEDLIALRRREALHRSSVFWLVTALCLAAWALLGAAALLWLAGAP